MYIIGSVYYFPYFVSNDVIVSKFKHNIQSEPLLRWLVAGLPLPIIGSNPKPLHVEFVMDEVALAEVSLRASPFTPLCIIPPTLHIHALT
jgi:hypothetical protein